ncbi:PilZ domain-containing protein [Ammoniphilus sp. CFH 90114]|uniref:PilZ domain-containing protein n=1 Tax=Ammoniphilus sp. CFH 90114 TaxID=2493665 RepID=UPI00100F29A9|nr:PilZ domain-containing protein [Ammoniphilus sp. CFH 90114]RXT05261.1 PilZ domain-containing protein [Ammoniphilus sp. CFH 90114]
MLGRRKHYRHYFKEYAKGTIEISEIKNRKIVTKKAAILIKDICGNGLRFSTELRFLASDVIIYKFDFLLTNHDLSFHGKIVRRDQLQDGTYEYGVQFIEEHKFLTHIINKLSQKILRNSAS